MAKPRSVGEDQCPPPALDEPPSLQRLELSTDRLSPDADAGRELCLQGRGRDESPTGLSRFDPRESQQFSIQPIAGIECSEFVDAIGQGSYLVSQQREQLIAHVRMGMDRREENRCRHACHRHVGHCDDPCRARPVVNRPELSEELASIDLAQQDLTTGDRLQLDADGSTDDEENIAACVLIIDDPLVTGCATPGALGVEKIDFRRIQRPE
jgi:hypothetical protein